MRVVGIRLTPQYTILDMQFTNRREKFYTQSGQYVPIGYIYLNDKPKLTNALGTQSFRFIKVEGIPLFPKKVKVSSVDQVNFSLYYERVPRGVELLNWGDCSHEDRFQCFEFLGLRIDNPLDSSSTLRKYSPVVSPSLLPSGETAKTLRIGDKLPLANIYFDLTKADLLPASFAELDQLALLLQTNPQLSIRLEGHTDTIGDPQQNLRLSQERALACQRYLHQKGIPLNRLRAVGYGANYPLNRTGTEEDRRFNRRVEFVILSL
ncbi:hypothetical protein GCM10028808_74970 [Spirosoma migulaei]